MARLKPPHVNQIIRSQYLVEFDRKPLDANKLRGFVLACSDTLTLLQLLGDDFKLNGYSIIRNADVRNYWVYDRPDYFPSRVLKLKGIKPEPRPEIDISNLSELLTSIDKHYPLLTIHREKISNDVCFIGHLAGMTQKTFTLFEIDPDAKWDGQHRYRFEDVTKVDFGGGYEEALALVASQDAKKNRRPNSDRAILG